MTHATTAPHSIPVSVKNGAPPRRAVRFWDRIAERYAAKPVPDEAAYQEKLRVTRTYLSKQSDVLEFGCGSGSTALVHAPLVRHILATDVSPKMIEIAQRQARDQGVENAAFRATAIEEFDAPDDSFDVVLGLSILHLLKDHRAQIAKVARVLKPGGVFVSSTACLGDTMAWFKVLGPIGHLLGLIPFVRVFTKKQLANDLINAGFIIEHSWQAGKGKAVFLVARKPG